MYLNSSLCHGVQFLVLVSLRDVHGCSEVLACSLRDIYGCSEFLACSFVPLVISNTLNPCATGM